jgi:hypothetical protein
MIGANTRSTRLMRLTSTFTNTLASADIGLIGLAVMAPFVIDW